MSVGPLCGRDPLNRVQQGGDAHRTAVVDGRRQDCPRWGRVILTGGYVHQLRAEPARRARRGPCLAHAGRASAARLRRQRGRGFIDLNSPEYLIWDIARRSRVDDLQSTTVASKDSRAILLNQMAQVRCAAAMKRGDAGDHGTPAMIVSVRRRAAADTVQRARGREHGGHRAVRIPAIGAHQGHFAGCDSAVTGGHHAGIQGARATDQRDDCRFPLRMEFFSLGMEP